MPWLVGFLCFTLVPFLMSFVLSFTNFNILSPDTKFVGFDNYVKLFTQDKLFIKSLKVTFKFAFISVPLRLIFALLVAMILNRKSRAVPVYRVVYYLPSIIGGSVAVSVMWRNLFTKAGVINSLLQAVGIDCRLNWLSNTKTALFTLILLYVWQFGSSMLIFLSGLKQIPVSYYEAAEVDGAGKVRQFFSITLPLLAQSSCLTWLCRSSTVSWCSPRRRLSPTADRSMRRWFTFCTCTRTALSTTRWATAQQWPGFCW